MHFLNFIFIRVLTHLNQQTIIQNFQFMMNILKECFVFDLTTFHAVRLINLFFLNYFFQFKLICFLFIKLDINFIKNHILFILFIPLKFYFAIFNYLINLYSLSINSKIIIFMILINFKLFITF